MYVQKDAQQLTLQTYKQARQEAQDFVKAEKKSSGYNVNFSTANVNPILTFLQ